MVLMLPVTGCAGGTVNVMARECTYDLPMDPDDADIDAMSDRLALRIDAHDALYDRWCGSNNRKTNQ